MNIFEVMNTMYIIKNPIEQNIKEILENDYHIIIGDRNKFGDIMIKYDFFVMDGLLYTGKLSDSTQQNIVITIESVVAFNSESFYVLWESYLKSRDIIFIDVCGYMNSAELNLGGYDHNTIKDNLKSKEVIFFNDIYSPFIKISDPVNIYIHDINLFGNRKPIENLFDRICEVKIVKNIKDTDIIVFPVTTHDIIDNNLFLKGFILDKNNLNNPYFMEKINFIKTKFNFNIGTPKFIIFFDIINFIVSAEKDKEDTEFKALNELSYIIENFNKKFRDM